MGKNLLKHQNSILITAYPHRFLILSEHFNVIEIIQFVLGQESTYQTINRI